MYQDEIFFARNTKKHKNRKKERLSMRDYIKAAAVVLLVICVVLFIVDIFMPTYGFFAKVDSGYVGVITHFGKIKDGVLPAGFHVTGYFDQVHPINVRTQIRDGEVVAFSSDIQQVTLFVSINYNVTPEAANTLYKTISGDYFATLISPRVNENVKVVVSNYTAESLIASRETLSSEVLELMKRDLEPYGITATAISIENIDKLTNAKPQEKADLLGQAYFARGFAHFVLCRFYGGMPYIDRTDYDDWDLERLSAYETYVRAAEDFQTAYTYLKEAGKMRRDALPGVAGHLTASDIGRPNGCTALAFRARALLYAASPLNNREGSADWQKAADACAEALRVALEWQYALQPWESYTDNFFGMALTNEVAVQCIFRIGSLPDAEFRRPL